MSVPLRWQAPQIVHETVQTPCRALRRSPVRRTHTVRLFLAVASACLIMCACTALGIQIGSANAVSQQNLRLVSMPSSHGKITLSNASIERKLGFVTVSGSVLNATRHDTIPNVEMVVELLDSHNHTLSMSSALIAYDPLPAGQVSPYSVEMNDNSKAVGVRIRPRRMLGGPLD